jgi:hypothetical protein
LKPIKKEKIDHVFFRKPFTLTFLNLGVLKRVKSQILCEFDVNLDGEFSTVFFFFSMDLSLVYEVVELAVLYEKNTRLYHLSGLLAGLLIHAWTRRQAWPSAGKFLPLVE